MFTVNRDPMPRKKGFTLIEIVLVVLISSSIMVIMYRLLETIPKVKNFNDARQTLIQQTNDAMDRFAIIFQDYTVDYEEYYNRSKTKCIGTQNGANFWKVGKEGYCTQGTNYGNGSGATCDNSGGGGCTCVHSMAYNETNNAQQSYGNYKNTFRDYGLDTDNDGLVIGDADDRDKGKSSVNAITDPNNIQELYLISHDGSRRIFLRRFLHEYDTGDKTLFGATGYYTIQILKLRGFDAGSKHNFQPTTSSGVFDGQLDTRACDYGAMFTCTGKAISSTLYPNYNLPHDKNDGWVDLFDEKLNITNWNIEISPPQDPDLAWTDMRQQINPYIKISITAGLSEHLASNRNWGGTGGFQYTLENVYDTKGFYIQ